MYMYNMVIGTRPNFPQSTCTCMVENWANVHTPMGKSFKTQCCRIPIDLAILAAIGHRFIAKKRSKTKNAEAQ